MLHLKKKINNKKNVNRNVTTKKATIVGEMVVYFNKNCVKIQFIIQVSTHSV